MDSFPATRIEELITRLGWENQFCDGGHHYPGFTLHMANNVHMATQIVEVSTPMDRRRPERT